MAGDLQQLAGEARFVLHSSVSLGEQVHHQLRQTLKNLKLENPLVTDNILLDVVCKAHNDSEGFTAPCSRCWSSAPFHSCL